MDQSVDRAAIMTANPGIKSAANWFWWIFGLSLVNSILVHSGSQTAFAVGLGFTLIADHIFKEFVIAAALVDALALGFFAVMAVFAGRGRRWAFLVGGIVYALDALISLFAQDFLGLGIHAWALFALWSGGMALHNAIKAAKLPPPFPPAPVSEPAPEISAAGSSETN